MHRVGGSLQGPGAEDNCLFTEAGETQGESVAWKPVLSLASIPKTVPLPTLLSFLNFFVCLFSKSLTPLESVCSMERA